MTATIYDANTAQAYDDGYRTGYDHHYPNESVVRLERWYFQTGRGRVLDYGFGFGANLIHLAERGYEVDGIDIAKSAADLVERKLVGKDHLRPRVHLRILGEGDGNRLPYADAMFDFIISNQIVYHLGNRSSIEHLLREFVRVLKPGGKMIVTLLGPTNVLSQKGLAIGDDRVEYVDVTGSLGRAPMVVYIFRDEAHVRDVFSMFEIDEVGWFDSNYCGINGYHHVVLCRKPAP